MVDIGGLRFPTKLFESQERYIQNPMETVFRQDDVFLATYPKTGQFVVTISYIESGKYILVMDVNIYW